jgi:hypothetical protein
MYIWALQRANICFSDQEDEILWDGDPRGVYTPKLGYVQLIVDLQQRETIWWWKKLWKQRCPTKGKILVWSILENKLLTWDNLQKRQFNGPGWCTLCKEQPETMDHLFIHFSFTKGVWADSLII